MNNVIKTHAEKSAEKAKAFLTSCLSAMVAAGGANVYALGTSIEPVEVDTDFTFNDLIGSFGGMVLALAQGVGLILVIWGAVQLASAFKSEEGESKTKAIWIIVAGAALFSVRLILDAAGVISG